MEQTARRIVVGIDSTEHGAAALRWAVAEAKIRGAELDLVHSWSWPVTATEFGVMPMPASNVEELERAAVGVIENQVAMLIDAGVELPPFVAHVAERNPASLVCEVAQGAELCVVGTHGRSGFVAGLMGSVSRQITHHAPCPVVVIHGQQQHESDEVPRRFVVGVDGSTDSLSAINWAVAAAAAGSTGGSVHVVQTWQYPTISALASAFGGALPNADMMDEATRAGLDAVLQTIEVPESVQLTSDVVEGSADHALRQFAESEPTTAIIVGKRGTGGFEGLLVGSVADRLTAHSSVPTIVVPAT